MEMDIKKLVKDLVKEYPNDYDLGKKVRELVNGLDKIKKDVVQKKDSKQK